MKETQKGGSSLTARETLDILKTEGIEGLRKRDPEAAKRIEETAERFWAALESLAGPVKDAFKRKADAAFATSGYFLAMFADPRIKADAEVLSALKIAYKKFMRARIGELEKAMRGIDEKDAPILMAEKRHAQSKKVREKAIRLLRDIPPTVSAEKAAAMLRAKNVPLSHRTLVKLVRAERRRMREN